jgi:hypothetical protein
LSILVCGDRRWDDAQLILNTLSKLNPKMKGTANYLSGMKLIVGGARGADKITERLGRMFGANVQVFNAEWGKYGKAAGPIRNRKMLDENPNLVLAFHDDLAHSKGTLDTVSEAKRRGIKVQVVRHT